MAWSIIGSSARKASAAGTKSANALKDVIQELGPMVKANMKGIGHIALDIIADLGLAA